MSRLKLLLIFFILQCIGCKNSGTPDADVLGRKKMQVVLWDIIQAEAYTNQFIKRDSSKNSTEENIKLQQRVFKIHHVTKDDFYSSYHYYQNHPAEMQSLLDSILNAKMQIERERYMPSLKPLKKL